MAGRRFQDIWKEQCEAARGVREQHGVVSALDYLLGEKLMTYAETAPSESAPIEVSTTALHRSIAARRLLG